MMLLLEDFIWQPLSYEIQLYLDDVYSTHIFNLWTVLCGLFWYYSGLREVNFVALLFCLICERNREVCRKQVQYMVIYFCLGIGICTIDDTNVLFLVACLMLTYFMWKLIYGVHGYYMVLSMGLMLLLFFYMNCYQVILTLFYLIILFYSTYIIIIKEFPEGNQTDLFHGAFLHLIMLMIHPKKKKSSLPKLVNIEVDLDHILLQDLSVAHVPFWGHHINNKFSPQFHPELPIDGYPRSSFFSEDERLSWQGEIAYFQPKSTVLNCASKIRLEHLQNICNYANDCYWQEHIFIFGKHILTKKELDEIMSFINPKDTVVSIYARGGWVESFLLNRGVSIIPTENTERLEYITAVKWLPNGYIRHIVKETCINKEYSNANILIINEPIGNFYMTIVSILKNFKGRLVIMFGSNFPMVIKSVLNEKYIHVQTSSVPIFIRSTVHFYMRIDI